MNKYLAVLLLLLTTTATQATDSFNSSTNILTMDSVIADGVPYVNVAVQLNGYSVVSEGGMANGSSDTFDSTTKIIFLNAVIVGGIQHNNVTVQLQDYYIISATRSSCAWHLIGGRYVCADANLDPCSPSLCPR